MNSHEYVLILSMDGNFKLQLKKKNASEIDGEMHVAFFEPSGILNAYLEKVTNDTDVRSSFTLMLRRCAYLNGLEIYMRIFEDDQSPERPEVQVHGSVGGGRGQMRSSQLLPATSYCGSSEGREVRAS